MTTQQSKRLPGPDPEPRMELGSWLVCVLICASIILAPLALGATGAWPRFALEGALGVAIIAWCAWCRPTPFQLMAPCGALAIVAVQIVPLSSGFATSIAPISGAAWMVANSETGGTGIRISMDPAATVLSGSRLFLGLAATLAVASSARHNRVRQTFFATMAVAGLVMWALGVAFPAWKVSRTPLGFISLAGPITDWLDPRLAPVQTSGCSWAEKIDVGVARYMSDSGTPGDGCGSYISSNQFAGGMCLTLPFVLAAWMALSRGRVPAIARHIVLLILVSAAVLTTAYLARSRAGSAAVLASGLVLWMLSAEARWLRVTTKAIVAAYLFVLAIFAAVLYSGRVEIVESLPASLASVITIAARDARGEASRLAFRMFLASPVAGVGLGCFAPVFSRMVPGTNRFHYAHNDYAQYLAETGLLGVAYAAALAGGLLWVAFRNSRACVIVRCPSRMAGWAAVAGIATHSGFDWNLHLPANALLASVAAGLALHVGGMPPLSAASGKPRLVILRALLAMVTVLVCASLLRDAVSETVQRHLRDAIVIARLHQKDPSKPSPDEPLAKAIVSAEFIAGFDPGNARLAIGIGHAKLHAAGRAGEATARQQLRMSADRWLRDARTRRAFVTGLPD